jgi:hypothetical protein
VRPADAPSAPDEGGRIVTRQLYETLVEVDCEGAVHPGLATSWSYDDEGRRWRFTLRPDARFWDGSPVTAEAVVRAWLSTDRLAEARRGAPRFVSSSVSAPLELGVVLRDPTTFAERFARPALAVTGPGRVGGWPLGSGPYRPSEPGAGGARSGEIRLVARAADAPGLTFVPAQGADARSALDAGADVVVSSDPAVLAYARALPDVTITPLPWSRTYVLAAPEGDAWGSEAPPTAPADALEGLARGAVRAEARPTTPPFWWREGGCVHEALPGSTGSAGVVRSVPPDPATPSVRRIVYPRGDAVAQGIAERLVALASRGGAVPAWLMTAVSGLASGAGTIVAAGLAPERLARAVRRSEVLAFVVPVPRAPGGPCASALLAVEDETTGALFAPGARLRITPLVDVRPSLILRRGVDGIALDGDGTLRFLPGASAPAGGGRP